MDGDSGHPPESTSMVMHRRGKTSRNSISDKFKTLHSIAFDVYTASRQHRRPQSIAMHRHLVDPGVYFKPKYVSAPGVGANLNDMRPRNKAYIYGICTGL